MIQKPNFGIIQLMKKEKSCSEILEIFCKNDNNNLQLRAVREFEKQCGRILFAMNCFIEVSVFFEPNFYGLFLRYLKAQL